MPLPTQRNAAVAGLGPLLLWSGGKTRGFRDGKRAATFVGFHSEADKYDELDQVAKKLSLPRMTVIHMDGVEKDYWYFGEELPVYPVITGPVAARVAKCAESADASAEAGISCRAFYDENGRFQTKFSLSVLVQPLVEQGYLERLQLVANGLMGDHLLAALIDHCSRVAPVADRAYGREVLPVELLLPLGPGPEIAFGKGEKSSMMTVIQSQHPRKLDEAYVTTLYRPDAVYKAADEQWDTIVAAAREFNGPRSAQAQNGEREQARETVLSPDQLEESIGTAGTEAELDALRKHALALRDAREITFGEQMRLGALIDERLDALMAQAR